MKPLAAGFGVAWLYDLTGSPWLMLPMLAILWWAIRAGKETTDGE